MDKNLDITFLGTGTSTGTPIIGCICEICQSSNPKDKRLRTSLFIKYNHELNFIIDTGPDLRTQLLREGINKCDFSIITHDHSDHLNGIDDLRPFTFFPKRSSLPVFCHPIHFKKIEQKFDYIFKRDQIFNKNNPYLGGGLPLLDLYSLENFGQLFPSLDLEFFLLPHGTGFTSGLLFDQRVAYLIDCHEIPEDAVRKLHHLNLDCVIIDCLQFSPHPSHLTIEKSFEYLRRIQPKSAFLIHMNHDIGHDKLEKMAIDEFNFPVLPAYDGLKINL